MGKVSPLKRFGDMVREEYSRTVDENKFGEKNGILVTGYLFHHHLVICTLVFAYITTSIQKHIHIHIHVHMHILYGSRKARTSRVNGKRSARGR